MSVHHGNKNAVKILQKTINHKRMSRGAGNQDIVAVDGVYGPKTEKWLKYYGIEGWRVLTFRIKFICDICRRNPKTQYNVCRTTET